MYHQGQPPALSLTSFSGQSCYIRGTESSSTVDRKTEYHATTLASGDCLTIDPNAVGLVLELRTGYLKHAYMHWQNTNTMN